MALKLLKKKIKKEA